MSLANAVQFPIQRGSSVRLYSMSAANNGLLSRFLTRFYFPESEEKVLPRSLVVRFGSAGEVYPCAIRSLRFLTALGSEG